MLQYYEAQARSNNNRSREAACHSLAELVRKLDGHAILPHMQRIMKGLLSAFRDDSWPVNQSCNRLRWGPLLMSALASFCA